MRCPNCSTSNPSNAKFCMECGIRLLVCPNCSTANFTTAKFCIECGTSLNAQPLSDRDTVPLRPAATTPYNTNGQYANSTS
ncbi:MAG TPA: zinc ribbon domain-containing protein, partial [Ktedonobacteraceae bacterium]|nr:zinc ribbon domain-containing protein [Ktedonobacteraceae bacterium]